MSVPQNTKLEEEEEELSDVEDEDIIDYQNLNNNDEWEAWEDEGGTREEEEMKCFCLFASNIDDNNNNDSKNNNNNDNTKAEVYGLLKKDDVRKALETDLDLFSFDFLSIRSALSLDFYGTMKLVNYIRSNVKDNCSPIDKKKSEDRKGLLEYMKANDHFSIDAFRSIATAFTDDQYLQPVIANDALLTHDFDELSDDEEEIKEYISNELNSKDNETMAIFESMKKLQEEGVNISELRE